MDRIHLADYPGRVRSIYFHDGKWVEIAFESYGYDEGGVYYSGTYETWEQAVKDIEGYLSRPISEWTNYNRTGGYPDLPAGIDPTKTGDSLVLAVRAGTLALPPSGKFELLNSKYWLKQWRSHENA